MWTYNKCSRKTIVENKLTPSENCAGYGRNYYLGLLFTIIYGICYESKTVGKNNKNKCNNNKVFNKFNI